MPQVEYGGRTYDVPEGTSPEDAINMIVRIKAANPPPDAVVPPPVAKGGTVGPNNLKSDFYSWIGGKLMETPEQRRQRAVESLQLLQKEYFAAPPQSQDAQLLQPLMDHAAFTATAENPHQVAKSKRPATTYRSIVSER